MEQFEITVPTDGSYLRVTGSGPAMRGDLHRLLERIFAETRSRDVWRVLLDLTKIQTPVGTFERYQLGMEFARSADRRLKLAGVGRPEFVDHFFETVARNRGGAVAVFTEESSALDWLTGAGK